MYGVLIALIPAFIVSLVYFGLGALIVTATSVIACLFFEWAIGKFLLKKETTTICDGSAVITGVLLAFNLPSNLPVWIIILGALFAIGVGKMSFGGLGNNPFNPALAGRVFLCFPLYVVYAALYGIFTIITYYSGFRAGFCFSAGATDLVFSASLPAAAKTWMIIPLGIAAFVVFYAVFYFAITKFDLKTPGREDEDEEAEKKVVLANNNYTEVASAVLAAVGGKENVKEVGYCATRLRFEVKDNAKVDEKAVKAAGAAGVIRPSKNACQVIIGTKVQFVYDELKKML